MFIKNNRNVTGNIHLITKINTNKYYSLPKFVLTKCLWLHRKQLVNKYSRSVSFSPKACTFSNAPYCLSLEENNFFQKILNNHTPTLTNFLYFRSQLNIFLLDKLATLSKSALPEHSLFAIMAFCLFPS